MDYSYFFEKIDVVLVDDRKENLLSLEAILACSEYNLVKMNSGEEVLRYLLDHTPALLLMDVQMPELNGFETAAIIKSNERTREIPIIFITAINKEDRFLYEGYEHGAVDYIYKPFDPYVLKSKVAAFAEMRRQQWRISQLVAVQRAATEALADANNVGDAISKILRALCNSLGWDLSAYWGIDKKDNVLHCQAEWHHPGDSMPTFIEESFKLRFFCGEGLPGKVWKDKKSLWVSNVTTDLRYLRALPAAQDKIHTVVGIPICVQDEMMGVLEVCSKKKLIEDVALTKIMSAIGSQIGQVLKRTEAYELVRSIANENAQLYREAQDAIRARDEFFSIASHELKTPLTSLKLLVQLTQRCVNPNEGIVHYPTNPAKMLNTASKQLDQLNHLVEDLLDVVKMREGKLSFHLEKLNLSELVMELTERYSTALSTAQCSLEVDVQPKVMGSWDRLRIEQVLVNLLSNAIKYAPGTPIKIKVSDEIGTAKIIVQDSGPGIAPEKQAKIFNRFERVVSSHHVNGLGLGLFIVKQIVEAHRGTIHIESESGKGSRFIVELPCEG